MLNVGDSLLILPSLLLLIFSVAIGGLDGLVNMGWCKWVEHPHVKERTMPLIPQNPRAFTSSLTCGKVLQIGVEVVVQPQHLDAIGLIVGNAPLWQLKACVVLN